MSPRTNARVAGATFLLYIAVGIGQMVLARSTQGGTAAERLALYARHAQDVRINVLLTVLVCGIAVTWLAGFAPDAVAQAAWGPMAVFEIALALWLLVRGVAVPARVQG